MVKPWLRSPCGAPVPATAPPTSRRTKAGGVNSMICQRSIGWSGAKPPTFWKKGGGGLSRTQRVTRTSSPSRSAFIGVSAIASVPSVVGWM